MIWVDSLFFIEDMSIRRFGSVVFVTLFGSMSLVASCSAANIVRGNVSDIDSTGNTSSTIDASYDSGTSGDDRYSVFVVQLSGSTDAVTDVSYGGASSTLLAKFQSQYAQFNNYNYIYGLANPPTSTNNIAITASQNIAANILAATYSNVDPIQPETAGTGSTSTQLSSWTSNFNTAYLQELAIIASGDNNGNMQAGDHATKISTTRPAGAGLQVWEGGSYSNTGANSFSLNGSNGGAMDVGYILLKPSDATSTPPMDIIVRGNFADYDATANTSSTISEVYDSGTTGTSRYTVVAVQLDNTSDVVTDVTYGNATATFLTKRQGTSSGGNKYSYLYGVDNPDTGANALEVHASQTISGRMVAVTYSNVSTSGPDIIGTAGLGVATDAWTGSFKAKYTGEVVVFQSSDAAGFMMEGERVSRLSTVRNNNGGDQVWDTTSYPTAGYNGFGIVGANGGGIDVSYITLHPIETPSVQIGIQRGTILDFENDSATSTSVNRPYDSGIEAPDRYTVVSVQLNGSTDVLSSVSYGGVSGRLLYKRKSQYSQGGNFNYIFGIVNPPTGTNMLAVTGGDVIQSQIAAITYSGVDASQPQLTSGAGYNASMSSLGVGFETKIPGSVGVMLSGDNNGGMSAGASTVKLSETRSSGNGLQVWQCGVYESAGPNSCHLNGPNGSASDIAYAILTPAP